jgi:hypothetical protein
MTGSRMTNWAYRIGSALTVCCFLLGLQAFAQNGLLLSGAGIPCSKCNSYCYSYWAGVPASQNGCSNGGSSPGGPPNYSCLASKCATWCNDCLPDGPNMAVTCTSPACWTYGSYFDPKTKGGNICSTACYYARCDATEGTDKICRDEVITEEGDNEPCRAIPSLRCIKCSCQDR